MGFNLDDYEPVAARLDRWLTAKLQGFVDSLNDFPRVTTTMVSEPGADICVMRAELWLGEMRIATGYAEEVRGSGNVNRSSHVENCETSAIGRALANAGYAGSDMTKRPSREEMGKVQRMTQSTTAGSDVVTERPANAPSDKQLWLVKKLHKDAGKLPPHNLGSMDKFEVSRLIEQLKGGEEIPPPSDYDAPEEPF
jgi:hypothetical protein